MRKSGLRESRRDYLYIINTAAVAAQYNCSYHLSKRNRLHRSLFNVFISESFSFFRFVRWWARRRRRRANFQMDIAGLGMFYLIGSTTATTEGKDDGDTELKNWLFLGCCHHDNNRELRRWTTRT